jgi:hypothetical protein
MSLSSLSTSSSLLSPTSTAFNIDSVINADSWEKGHYLSLTLWDIEREFEKSHEAYEQWQTRNRRKRSKWECFGSRSLDDDLGRALRLGRQVRAMLEKGIEAFGSRFEQGDCKSLFDLVMTIPSSS